MLSIKIPMYPLKRRHRRRLFNLFAFALLAFAIYLTVFHKEESTYQSSQSVKNTASVQVTTAVRVTH